MRLEQQLVADAVKLLSCFSHQTSVLVGDIDIHLGAEVQVSVKGCAKVQEFQ